MAKGKVKYRTRTVVQRTRRRAQKMTLPISLLAGVGIPLAGSAKSFTTMGFDEWLAHQREEYLGISMADGSWHPFSAPALRSIIMGAAIHWGANKLGVNRALGRAKIPVARV